jgi:hypothetical protein
LVEEEAQRSRVCVAGRSASSGSAVGGVRELKARRGRLVRRPQRGFGRAVHVGPVAHAAPPVLFSIRSVLAAGILVPRPGTLLRVVLAGS